MADANIRAVITAEDKASGVISGVGTSFGKLTAGVAAGTLIAQGFTAALHGVEDVLKETASFIEDSVKATIDLGTETLQLQRNFGLTAEQASGLIAVFDRFGVDVDQISTAFGIFQKRIVDVSEAQKVGIKTNALLGIGLTDSKGNLRSMADILSDVADKFKSGVVPASERAGVAMDLFGRSGKTMIPILLQGRDGIAELEDKAKSMGIVLSQQGVDNILKYIQSQKTLNEAIEGVKIQIGSALLPEITKVIQSILAWIQANGGVQEIMQKKVIPVIQEVITWIQNNKQTFLDLINAIVIFGKVFGDVIKFDAAIFKYFHDTVAGGIYDIVHFFQLLPGWIATAFKDLAKIIEAPFLLAFNNIKQGIVDVINTFNRVRNDITGAPGHAVSGVKGLLSHIPGFASGGVVPGPIGAPTLAVVHGGETVIPTKGGAPASVNISINAGAYMGSQQDARRYASLILGAIQDIATSKNLTTAQLLGVNK